MDRDYFLLYPIYINQNKTISEGRKFCKTLCIANPTYAEIKMALEAMGLEFTEEINKRHPRDFFNYGRFSIKKKYGKQFVIQGLKHHIEEIRKHGQAKVKEAAVSCAATSRSTVPNKLNLVPRKMKGDKKKKKS